MISLQTPTSRSLVQAINPIIQTLMIDQIFYCVYRAQQETIHQLYILISNTPGQGLLESRALCTLLLAKHPGYRCYLAYANEINQKIKQGNIRAQLICCPENLIYEHPNPSATIQKNNINYSIMQSVATNFFNKSIDKILAFEEGYNLFLKREHLTQASFILHQIIELSFRLIENLILGKEKISHSIKQHQVYIKPYCSKIGSLFSKSHELSLMEKLDQAYKSTRYDLDFHLNKDELFIAFNKSKEMASYLALSQLELLTEIANQQKLAIPTPIC